MEHLLYVLQCETSNEYEVLCVNLTDKGISKYRPAMFCM